MKGKNFCEEQFSDSVSNSPIWDKLFFSKIPDSVRVLCLRQNTLTPCAERHLGIRKTLSWRDQGIHELMRLKMRHKGGALALHQVHIGILLVFFLKCVVFVGRNRTTTGKDTTSLSDESESELLSAVESGSCSLTAIAAVNSIWLMITTSLFHITIS